jgi:hypothetical protein
MTINSKTLAALVMVILFGGILISAQLGWWQTENSKVAATFKEGEFAGQANPADIRGSYTFGDVEKNFGVPASVLGEAFNVSTDPAAFQIMQLEEMAIEGEVEIGTSSVRLFVAFYKNMPFDLSTDTYLPESASALLKKQNLTSEQSAYLETHTTTVVVGEAVPSPQAGTTPQPESTAQVEATAGEASTERIIKGSTTFGDILSWGVSQPAIEKILGMPMPTDPAATPKEFCTSNSLDYETIKPALQAEVDKTK